MKTRVLVLGSTGMLGSAVARHFMSKSSYEVTTTYRNKAYAFGDNPIRFDALTDPITLLSTEFDYVINCIGTIKPHMAADPQAAIRLNALLPWELADWCRAGNMNLIHISTDCVYSGAKGKYVESDVHDAPDDYGKSKSLGECSQKAMVLRTSVIGEELHHHLSLLDWAKQQKGKTVGGFSTHLWNGVTTNMYARVCEQIMENGWYETGLFHVHAADDVNKFEMLHMFNKKFDLNMTIEEKTPAGVDRTLRTEKSLNGRLAIPTVAEMIEQL
ncbi:MAG: SDR family oxidoreductase [Clostridia bacterium]|nr:SDR family oxidoreductase [Clostridia bacterium]